MTNEIDADEKIVSISTLVMLLRTEVTARPLEFDTVTQLLYFVKRFELTLMGFLREEDLVILSGHTVLLVHSLCGAEMYFLGECEFEGIVRCSVARWGFNQYHYFFDFCKILRAS